MSILMHSAQVMTPDQLDRRTVLKGITLGAGSVVFQGLTASNPTSSYWSS